jgi:hypothetical protein
MAVRSEVSLPRGLTVEEWKRLVPKSFFGESSKE